MPVTTTELPKGKELNDLIRHPISALQETFETFETQARDRLRDVLASGNTRLLELDGALAKVKKDDWTVPGMRKHLDELRARAETLREKAMKRAQVMPGEAVDAIVGKSRTPIQKVAKSLAEMAKKLEPAVGEKAAAVAKPIAKAVKPAVEKVEAKA
jgi:hypothetical protein